MHLHQRQPKGWLALATILVIIIIFILLYGCGSTVEPQIAPAAAVVVDSTTLVAQTPPPGATPTWSGDALQATAVAIARTIPTLSPNPHMEPTKDAALRQDEVWDVAIQTAVALYPPPTPIFYPELLTPVAHDPWPTAIIDKRTTSQGVIYDDSFIGPPCSYILDSNHWYGQAVGEHTHVCAGADNDRPVKGAIVVEVWHAGDDNSTYIGTYWTPSDQGAVHIQDVVGNQVILVSKNNMVFSFDLATRQWLSSTPGPSPSASVSPIPTSTAGTGYPTLDPNGKSNFETAVAQHLIAIATSVALTPPIDKIPETPGTPRPTATIELGMLSGGCGTRENAHKPIGLSCWRGLFDGHYVDVESGKTVGDNPVQQGYVMVNVWPNSDWSSQNIIYYVTPQLVGGVRIASINGTLFTLVSEDGQHTFVFDVATREWASPTPGPSPSVSVSPIPSVSPLPTQQP